MRFARQETETETETDRASRWSPNGDRSELAAAQEAPATPTPPIQGAQVRELVVAQENDSAGTLGVEVKRG